MRKLVYLISILLLLVPSARIVAAGQNADSNAKVAKIKRNVTKLGVGSKATATITLNDGSKVKGYVYSVADEDFVIRNRKTDAATTIRYADVKNVDDDRGRRNAKLAALFVGIGAAITVVAVFGAIAANER